MMKPLGRWAILIWVATVSWNCSDVQQRNDYSGPVYCSNGNLTRTKGMINKHFAAQFTYYSTWIKSPQYLLKGKLPPGLYLNEQTGLVEGTPTEAGFWRMQIGVRDAVNGTHDQPAGMTYYYFYDFEIDIYDKLTDDKP